MLVFMASRIFDNLTKTCRKTVSPRTRQNSRCTEHHHASIERFLSLRLGVLPPQHRPCFPARIWGLVWVAVLWIQCRCKERGTSTNAAVKARPRNSLFSQLSAQESSKNGLNLNPTCSLIIGGAFSTEVAAKVASLIVTSGGSDNRLGQRLLRLPRFGSAAS